MEYEKHIKRLVLGYLKKECKAAYKVFLKYNFHNQHKHIPTRVAGQTLEDILRIYSRIEEIVQGHLEDTNYYKERSAEFSAPIYLDDQLLYLLDKDQPLTPVSTPCPRSPAESSVVESQHENELFNSNDVETTPEHTLPGNISTHGDDYQSKIPYRRDSKSPVSTAPCMEKATTLNKKKSSEITTVKGPEKTEFQKKTANSMNTSLNLPDIPCFPHRSENEKNKEGVGTELDDMLQDFLGTPIVNTISKTVIAECSTSASGHVTQDTTPSRTWQHIDDHNNGAVSSILAATNRPNNKPADNGNDYGANRNNFQEQPVTSTLQVHAPPSTNFTNNQYLLPTSVGMYIVPQTSTSTSQSNNQQQQYFIVNQPVVVPQPAPIMQVLQPLAPANRPVVIHPNQKTPVTKDNLHLTEQDIMTMPTIILNERNEITYADAGSFPSNTPLKLNEAHNIKEYINLFGASDQSPVLKLCPKKKGIKCQPPIKPTPTIKVEIFQRDTLPVNITNVNRGSGTSNDNNSQNVSNKSNNSTIDCTGLPNLNDFIENETIEKTHSEPCEVINKEFSDAENNDPKKDSHEKVKSRLVGTVCTPSPLNTILRKPTPKSGSHVRSLTFPSPTRSTSEKPESRRNSPRIINKRQATKDLFKNENEEEKKSKAKVGKVQQSTKIAKTATKSTERNVKPFKKESSKSPRKVIEKDKTKPSKKCTKKEIAEKDSLSQFEGKHSWDSKLRKLIPSIAEQSTSTPVRRASTRKKTRQQSSELNTPDPDGKKLEDALKTPDKSEKLKRKTPSRKKNVKTLNSKKLDDTPQSQHEETKGETKVLSPSKLNANKRNILPNDVDDITPNILKESAQYPISSKTRRNISNLLETPIKEDFIPPTPGTVPDTTDTPFTPMLRANIKDYTEGDTFSINTPNFPVTPGLAAMVNTSADYYILNDNENNKVTEATVLSEEKKSSVRKSDDEEVEFSPRVYGSKEILETFNKSSIGRKNLELLDNRGVKWDGSSDKEERSGDNSENNSDDESNNTVIQNPKVEPTKGIKILPRKRKSSGKCMATLHSQLLKEIKDRSEGLIDDLDLSNPEDVNLKLQNDEKDKNGELMNKDRLNVNKIIRSCSSGSDSEVLGKRSYEKKKMNSQLHDNILDTKGSDGKKVNTDRNNMITASKCTITTQEVKETISDVCLESNLGSKTPVSLKAQLEEKKKRWIALEKSKQPVAIRKTPRRAALKPQPNFNLDRNKRKLQSPKKVVQVTNLSPEKEITEDKNENNRDFESNINEPVENNKYLKSENHPRHEINTEYHTGDSQDEFFKKSGTNLHRKNKGSVHTTKEDSESKEELNDEIKDKASTQYISLGKIDLEDKKISNLQKNETESSNLQKNETESLQDVQKIIKDSETEKSNKFKESSQNRSTESTSPNEFEKSWEDCHTSAIESEDAVLYHDETKTHTKKIEEYDFNILQKKIVLGLPCSDGSTEHITLTVTSFDTLLDIKPSDESETTDASRDEADSSFETLELKPDAVSDSENPAGNKTDITDFKCTRKRKYRSDSCNSNSSTKKIRKNEIFNEMNIQKVLTKIHGPGPSNQK